MGEYATPLRTMRLVRDGGLCAMDDATLKRECEAFTKRLQDILDRTEYSDRVLFVEFDDREGPASKSRVLCDIFRTKVFQ